MGRTPGNQHLIGARPEGQRAQLMGALRRPELWEDEDPILLDPGRGRRRTWVELLGAEIQRNGGSEVLENRVHQPFGAKDGRGQEVLS